MKFMISENKLETTIQKMINKTLSEMKEQLSNVNTINDIPDWMSYDSYEYVDDINNIKVNRIVHNNHIRIYVDVYIDSITLFDVTETLFDIGHYIKNRFGVDCFLIENNIIKAKESQEW